MPDVLVDFQGLRVAIEGEFDSPQADRKATKSALSRVEEGIAHMGVALVYPAPLRVTEGNIDELKRSLATTGLQFAIITETEASQKTLPLPFVEASREEVFSFVRGDINALADALRRSYDSLVKEEVLETAVGLLEQGIERFVSSLLRQPASTTRFASALGIRDLPKSSKPA